MLLCVHEAVGACHGVKVRGKRCVASCLSYSERLTSSSDGNTRYFQWYRGASAGVHRNTKTRVAVRSEHGEHTTGCPDRGQHATDSNGGVGGL